MQALVVTGSCFCHQFPNNSIANANANAKCRIVFPSTSRPSCNMRNQSTSTRSSSLRTTWPSISVALFGSGFFLGPLIDGLHSRVELVVYQNGAIDVGPLRTSIWVPLLLGLFYCTVGFVQLLVDERVSLKSSDSNQEKAIASLLALIVLIELSAELYKAGTPDNSEAYVLFAAAEFIWVSVNRSWFGFLLASIFGLAGVMAEVPLMKFFHLWYYPQANIEVFGEGLVSWTLPCYFVYILFLINYSRWLKSVISAADAEDMSS